VSAAELAELAAQIDDLVAFQTSALCFIGHMTDDRRWWDGEWRDTSSDGADFWTQGPNSDSQKAYDDCL
jgi:hypothetical protein